MTKINSHMICINNGGKYIKVNSCSLNNPLALRIAKTLWSFGHSECNRVKCNNSFYLNFHPCNPVPQKITLKCFLFLYKINCFPSQGSIQSVAIYISSKCEFPLTFMHFSVCKLINFSTSVHAIQHKNILVERQITGAIYTANL